VSAVVVGAISYVLFQPRVIDLGIVPPVVVSLLTSALAMFLGGLLGRVESTEMLDRIDSLHAEA
jgi:hypothetical protein